MNNILHLKYAVEIERTGSITKAAENLYMGQPNLSRAIRELEDSLGISIFMRSSKGVAPTDQGRVFLNYARDILRQIEEMENLCSTSVDSKQRFDISVPSASYVSYAFTGFLKEMDLSRDISVNYRETNSMQAIKNVTDGANNIALVRYQTVYEPFFLKYLKERRLQHEAIWEFEKLAIMSQAHPLAWQGNITRNDLDEYTEIVQGDVAVPNLPASDARMMDNSECRRRSIVIYERGSQFELLSRLPTTFMWVSPIPEDVLECFDLVQKKCPVPDNSYRDVLICREGYQLNRNEILFLEKLRDTVEMVKV